MSKSLKSGILAAVTLAAAVAAVQAPASAYTGGNDCTDPVYMQKNFFRCLQLNGN